MWEIRRMQMLGERQTCYPEEDYDYLRNLDVDNFNYYPYFKVIGIFMTAFIIKSLELLCKRGYHAFTYARCVSQREIRRSVT